MRNFQQASTPSKVLESGVSWLISPPMHLNSLLDVLPGVFFFTKCQETSSKLEGDSLSASNLGKRSIGFVSTAFHISFQWESQFLHHNWLPQIWGKVRLDLFGLQTIFLPGPHISVTFSSLQLLKREEVFLPVSSYISSAQLFSSICSIS